MCSSVNIAVITDYEGIIDWCELVAGLETTKKIHDEILDSIAGPSGRAV